MPFLAALPAILPALSAAGVAIPAAASIAIPAVFGALQVASGIAQKDPLKAIMGAAGGFGGALGGLGGMGNTANAAASAANSVGQGATSAFNAAPGILSTLSQPMNALKSFASDPMSSAADSINELGNTAAQSGMNSMSSALQPAAPSGGKMSLLENIAGGITGAGSAAQGIMSLIQSFKNSSNKQSAGLHLGGLDLNLPSSGQQGLSQLPGTPRIEPTSPGKVPNLQPSNISDNALLLKLLGAYQT